LILKRPAILVVEEESIHRDDVAMALTQAGYDVVLAGTGAEALSFLEDGIAFAGLYTDVRLPGHIDGWAVGSQLRARCPDVPIIYASAGDDRPEMMLRHPGMFVPKPVHPHHLKLAFQT
jgi:CheY-like chemotaxis protein